MKTLKKVLAVVLALAMVLGMTVTASAGYKDAEKINYKEAVAVMSLAGVLNGYTDGSFKPEGTLTRAEAAKMIVYMLGLEDTSLGYKANFGDISGHWAETPISVATGLGIVAGMGNGNYEPNGTLTGFQWAKILLCAMGYDAEVEGMLGAGWEAKVAKLIKAEKMDDGIKKFDGSKAVTRETAAQMAFNVVESIFVGYPDAASTAVKFGTDLKEKKSKFGKEDSFAIRLKLTKSTDNNKDTDEVDKWGRPGITWYVNEGNSKKEKKVFVADEVVATYTEEVKGCKVLEDLGYDTDDDTEVDFDFVGGLHNDYNDVKHTTDKSCKADEKKFGGQGVLTEIYEGEDDDEYIVVEISTYLAYVTKVTEEKTNKAGHVTTDASVTVTVFDGNDSSVTLKDATGYDKKDYVLVQFAKNTVNGDNYVIVGLADTFEGSLTKKTSKNVYTIAGEDYPEAAEFNLGKGDGKIPQGIKYTWFLDQYGNLIGRNGIDTTDYAVITNVEWSREEKAAFADLLYFGGETAKVEIGTADEFVDGWTSNTDVPFGVEESGKQGVFGLVSYANDKKNDFYDGIALYVTTTDEDEVVYFSATAYVTGVTFDSEMTAFYDGSTRIIVDEETEFIVRTTNDDNEYEYLTFTGVDEIPEMLSGSATAFYVAKDGVASKVYIKSYTAANEVGNYVFATSATTSEKYDKKTKHTYTAMDLYIDGELVEDVLIKPDVKIEKGKLYKAFFDGNIIEGVGLINEYMENESEDVDYLAGDVTYKNGRLYASEWDTSSDTEVECVYNISDLDDVTIINATDYSDLKEAVEEDASIWVTYSVVKGKVVVDTIYIGTELSHDTTLVPDTEDATLANFTLVKGTYTYEGENYVSYTYTADLEYEGAFDLDLAAKVEGAVVDDENISATDSYTQWVEVYAEDGYTYEYYYIVVVYAHDVEVAMSSADTNWWTVETSADRAYEGDEVVFTITAKQQQSNMYNGHTTFNVSGNLGGTLVQTVQGNGYMDMGPDAYATYTYTFTMGGAAVNATVTY